jgi:hypothetical protein
MPRALAAGRVLGRSQADARCYLVLSDWALMVVVKARRRGALLRFLFEDLAYVGPAPPLSGKRAYEVWAHAWPDGPRGLAFTVERSRRGAAFAALLEEAVRGQRPDLLSADGAAVVVREEHRLMEPSDLWLG